ncbi:HIT domain-containing protein [Candidatus Pacearchaeota archaeon]|nr:HIT domain-containing protein [Candidatus Pacearchaeota archaeon]
MEDCIFCKIANGEIPCGRIYENESFFSVPDKNQKVPGHSLIISKRHFKTTLDLPTTSGKELLDCIKKTAMKIIKKQKAHGFNLVNNNFPAAGQIVQHVHYHILPRKKGDKSPFVY